MTPGRLGALVLLLAGLLPADVAADHAGAATARGPEPCAVRVESFEEKDGADFNLEIERAVAAQERWPREPVQLALRRLGVGEEMSRNLCLDFQGNRSGFPDSLTATALTEGLADDSLAGVWLRLELRRLADGTWRVTREAWARKCARGPYAGRYQSLLCP